MGNETPLGIALIICDRVITDAVTQEKTLVGTFNHIHAPSFPCIHHRMTVFVAITNGRGNLDAEIRCTNTDFNTIIFGMKGVIPFPDPNQVIEMAFQFNNLTFLKPGVHAVEFFCDKELVLHRRFQVSILEQPQPPKGT